MAEDDAEQGEHWRNAGNRLAAVCRYAVYDILAAIERVHTTLHAEGTVRLSTHIKIGTRTDKEPTLAGKLF